MDKDKYRRFGWAIYSFVFAVAVVIGLFAVFVLKTGHLYQIGLSVSTNLFVVALVFFLVERLFLYDPQELQRKELADQLQDVVKVLKDVTDVFKYTDVQSSSSEAFQELINAYEMSETSIDVISWRDIEGELSQEHTQKYAEATEKRLNRAPQISFRWLLWTEEHLDQAQAIVKSLPSFFAAEIGFFIPTEENLPTIPCAVVDNKMVNFGWGYLGKTQMDQVNVTLKQPNAVNAFASYFAYLWQKSTILKEQGKHDFDDAKVAEVRRLLDVRKNATVQWSQEEAYGELERAYKTSEKSIDIISWKELRVQPTDVQKMKYFVALEERVKESTPILYRRILWRQEHLEILEERIEDYNRYPNLEIRFATPPKGKETPLMPCVIVDERIANFGMGYLGRVDMDEVNVTLRQPKAVEAFVLYFSYLWQHGIPLKKRNEDVNAGKLSEAKKHLRSEMSSLLASESSDTSSNS